MGGLDGHMTVYTGRGDAGETDLRDMSRISKAAPRIEAYGTVDELNALLGTIMPTGFDDIDEQLVTVQNHLHIIQASLADPGAETPDPALTDDDVGQLETWMDTAAEELEPLTSFILPGGSAPGAQLHHARAVCRRAERRLVALAEEVEGGDSTPLVYLNRLSDLLFTLGRLANARAGHTERSPSY